MAECIFLNFHFYRQALVSQNLVQAARMLSLSSHFRFHCHKSVTLCLLHYVDILHNQKHAESCRSKSYIGEVYFMSMSDILHNQKHDHNPVPKSLTQHTLWGFEYLLILVQLPGCTESCQAETGVQSHVKQRLGSRIGKCPALTRQ